ncbi:MAG: hypothetical protein IJR65_02555 [Oscillospiraceae bacterium]|nr:hypothetical protein [Oscillospiraceae bacterium]
MKATVKRLFALLLCLCLLLPAAPLTLAEAGTEELAAPAGEPSTAELSPVVGAESLTGEAADAESEEQEHFEPLEGGVPETEEIFFETPGESGCSLGGAWGDEGVISAAWDAISEDEIVEEGPLSPVIGPAEGPEGEAALLGSPSLSLSADNLTIPKGTGQAIYVYVRSLDRPVTLKCYTSDSGCYSLSWGEWDTANQRIKLTVKGLDAGSGKVSIKLLASPSESLIDAKTLNINVSDAKLTVDPTTLTLRKGSSAAVLVKASGYQGSSYLKYGTTNQDAFSCAWQSYSYADGGYPLRITGKAKGQGTVTVYYMSSNNAVLATRQITVQVTEESPQITVNASSLQLNAGQKKTLEVSYSGYSGEIYMCWSNSNNTACQCAWGQWKNNSTCYLDVTGKQAGSGTVTLTLNRRSDGVVLASRQLPVTVVSTENPQLTLSTASLTLTEGGSATVTATVRGVSGSYYLSPKIGNTAVCGTSWGYWSSGSIPLTVTGRSAGSTTVTVGLYRTSNNELLKTQTLSVTVKAQNNASLSQSTGSLTIRKGNSGTIRYNYSGGSLHVYYDGSLLTPSWGSCSTGVANLILYGKAEGSCTVRAELWDSSNRVLKTVSCTVTVQGGGGGGSGSRYVTNNVYDFCYPFRNFSVATTPLELIRLIFSNERANTIPRDIGYGGNCFGFATSGALIYMNAAEKLRLRDYGGSPAKLAYLTEGLRNYSLGYTAKELVMALQCSQLSGLMKRSYGVSSVVSITKSEIDAGRPVIICIWGNGGGHALLCYGYIGNNLVVADCNRPLLAQTIVTNGSSTWSYAPLSWGNGSICAIKYADALNLWNRRRTSAANAVGDGAALLDGEDDDRLLLLTTEDDFDLFCFDRDEGEEALLLSYRDGAIGTLDPAFEGEVEDLPQPVTGGGAGATHFLYLPRDYTYTVEDRSAAPDGMRMTLVDQMLSSTVETESGSFTIYVDDLLRYAGGSLNDAPESTDYAITIGSMLGGQREEIVARGVTTDVNLGVGLTFSDGKLGGAGDGAISISTEAAGPWVETCASSGGTVYPAGRTVYQAGDACACAFVPDEGYVLGAVYVNGEALPPEELGSVWEHSFTAEDESYVLNAVFKRSLADCEYELESSDESGAEPVVKRVTLDGIELTEGVDYLQIPSVDENGVTVGAVILAAPESPYAGSTEIRYEDTAIESVLDERPCVRVRLRNAREGTVIAAYFSDLGRLIALRAVPVEAGQTEAELDFGKIMPKSVNLRVYLLDKDGCPQTKSR